MANTTLASLTAEPNNSARRGEIASPTVLFGPCSRYSIFAVHTRFDAVQWFVNDAEAGAEPVTIRQEDSVEAAIAGLSDPMGF